MTERPFPTIPAREDGGGPRMDGCGGSGARRSLVAERDEGRWLLSPGLTESQPNRRHYDPASEPAPTVAVGHDTCGWTWTRPATSINGDPRVSAPGRHDPNVSGSQQADAIRLTIAELATLQGFPPDWTWTGTKTAQARQVGNAVPPALAEAVVRANLTTRKETR